MAFMAVVFLIGILGQPFELFNRAPIPLVEGRKRNMFVFCARVCLCYREFSTNASLLCCLCLGVLSGLT